MKSGFSISWKSSTQPRKQRKYRENAPLHLKQKMLHVHLSPDLREKHGKRNVQIKTGDKVRIMRGGYHKKEGKVEKVDLKREKVFITGMDYVKREGSKVNVAFSPSNLMIIELNLTDKKRKKNLENKKTEVQKKEAQKTEAENKK
jgi:large subunit ribosomal protein L24